MAEIVRESVLAYPPAFLFEIAADIEKYPAFLPACERVRILEREKSGAFLAEMEVAYRHMLREKWISRVHISREDLEIRAQLVEGPFSRMDCLWRFSPHGKGGKVHLRLIYEIASPLLSITLKPLVGYAARRLTQSFEARAHRLAAEKALS